MTATPAHKSAHLVQPNFLSIDKSLSGSPEKASALAQLHVQVVLVVQTPPMPPLFMQSVLHFVGSHVHGPHVVWQISPVPAQLNELQRVHIPAPELPEALELDTEAVVDDDELVVVGGEQTQLPFVHVPFVVHMLKQWFVHFCWSQMHVQVAVSQVSTTAAAHIALHALTLHIELPLELTACVVEAEEVTPVVVEAELEDAVDVTVIVEAEVVLDVVPLAVDAIIVPPDPPRLQFLFASEHLAGASLTHAPATQV